MAERVANGMLVMVVGPSGVGKDTLINGARRSLRADPRFVFVRRIVTRRAEADVEDHDSLSEADFLEAEARGRFALTWQAHGLRYALPLSAATDVSLGKIVVANVSRHVVGLAADRFGRSAVVQVSAEISLRADRLARRGREGREDIVARLARDAVALPEGVAPIVIDNSDSVANGVARMILCLRSLVAARANEPPSDWHV
jgi:phosphonate metabolism protein PhnN/1,5-bisphosphokinase (PRPP-forming)